MTWGRDSQQLIAEGVQRAKILNHWSLAFLRIIPHVTRSRILSIGQLFVHGITLRAAHSVVRDDDLLLPDNLRNYGNFKGLPLMPGFTSCVFYQGCAE